MSRKSTGRPPEGKDTAPDENTGQPEQRVVVGPWTGEAPLVTRRVRVLLKVLEEIGMTDQDLQRELRRHGGGPDASSVWKARTGASDSPRLPLGLPGTYHVWAVRKDYPLRLTQDSEALQWFYTQRRTDELRMRMTEVRADTLPRWFADPGQGGPRTDAMLQSTLGTIEFFEHALSRDGSGSAKEASAVIAGRLRPEWRMPRHLVATSKAITRECLRRAQGQGLDIKQRLPPGTRAISHNLGAIEGFAVPRPDGLPLSPNDNLQIAMAGQRVDYLMADMKWSREERQEVLRWMREHQYFMALEWVANVSGRYDLWYNLAEAKGAIGDDLQGATAALRQAIVACPQLALFDDEKAAAEVGLEEPIRMAEVLEGAVGILERYYADFLAAARRIYKTRKSIPQIWRRINLMKDDMRAYFYPHRRKHGRTVSVLLAIAFVLGSVLAGASADAEAKPIIPVTGGEVYHPTSQDYPVSS